MWYLLAVWGQMEAFGLTFTYVTYFVSDQLVMQSSGSSVCVCVFCELILHKNFWRIVLLLRQETKVKKGVALIFTGKQISFKSVSPGSGEDAIRGMLVADAVILLTPEWNSLAFSP